MITRTFKLCLNAGTGSAPYINVSQYDEGETWLFELYSETGERYIPSTGAIVGVKSDGHGIANTGTVDSEGRVVITETEQMTAAAGRAIYELSIDGLTHGTANFIVNVEKKPIDGAIMSDSDLSLISQAVDSAAVIVDVIGDGDPSEVIGEHVGAWLDAHPEATTTVLDGAITAPKLNNSLWDKILVNEEVSGNPASFDDGADDVPVSSLKVNLEPIQTGTGDPSPSNVRPIIAANGKNLLQNTGTSKTENGITWTLNADGSVKCVGTATANSLFVVNTFNFVSGTSYMLTGCPSGGASATKWQIQILSDLNGGAVKTETGTGQTIDDLSGTYYVRLVVRSGNTVDFTWYPMIRLSSITDSTYQPYQGIMVERTGKNLFDKANGGKNLYVGAGDTTGSGGTLLCFLAKKGCQYTINMTGGNRTGLYYYDANSIDEIVSGITLTLVTGSAARPYTFVADRDGVYCYYANTDFLQSIADSCMVELGSTASDYEAYNGTSYPISLGQSVYGGTVDLATGVLTVTKKFVTSSNFVKETSYDVGNSSLFSVTGINDANINPTLNRGSISDKLKYDTAILNVERAGFYVGYGHIYARIAGISTLSDFNTAIGGSLSVAYTLATPQTIQLTPTQVKTLLGYNNISSSGTVEVIYHADTKLYVDKMTAVDNNIIAPTEETFTATRNYTTNDLVIVNDTLYKVTANIATGSAITPNSNVQQTTLGALIKALS